MTEREFNRIKHAQWREANPERQRANKRAWYARNRERVNAARRAKRRERNA